jgi:hypothetical protein
MSPWTDWQACDKASGVKMRERTVNFAGRNGGIPCGILTEYDDCVVHCEASPWTDYTPCVTMGAQAGTR